MKYIKKFESHKSKISHVKINDYITIKELDNSILGIFLATHIGQVIAKGSNGDIFVKFLFTEEDSKQIRHLFSTNHCINIDNIDLVSNNLEDLKIKINAKKYNL